MRRLLPWILLLSSPFAACSAEQAPAPAAPLQDLPSLAADVPPPVQVAANTPAASAPVATASSSDKYITLAKPQPTQTPGKIEVVEIFLYTCPHCYAFEPQVNAWRARLPADAVFVRVPASFGGTGPLLARSYYTAEALGVLDKMHTAIFTAIHKQHRPLNTEEDMMKLFAENGVDPQAFRATLRSFGVDSKARRAAQLEVGYNITGVPAMAVNGKYAISMRSGIGPDEMLKIAEELIAKERAAAR